jgi:hypothetical protein
MPRLTLTDLFINPTMAVYIVSVLVLPLTHHNLLAALAGGNKRLGNPNMEAIARTCRSSHTNISQKRIK